MDDESRPIYYNHHTMADYQGSRELRIIPPHMDLWALTDAEAKVYSLIYTFKVIYDEASSFTDEYLMCRCRLGREEAMDALASLMALGLIEHVGDHMTAQCDYPVYAVIDPPEPTPCSRIMGTGAVLPPQGPSVDETCLFIPLDRTSKGA